MFIRKKKTIAIFDIGSSSIGVAIATFSVNQKKTQPLPIIFFAKRYQLPISEKVTFKSFINAIFTTFDKVVEEVSNQKIKIDKTAIFLASPFYISKTNIIKQKGDKDIFISPSLVKSIIEAKTQNMIKDQPTLYSDLIDDEVEVFENIIMQIKLNGYKTHNPYSQKVKSLLIANHIALGSKTITTKLKEIIIRRLGRQTITFNSFTFAAFNIWQDIVAPKNNFMLLDITGEISDITVVCDDYLAENISFPRGRNYLIRETAKALKTNNEEAYSTLKEYILGNLSARYKENLETILQPLKTEWIKNIGEAFTLVMETALLPETVYVIGDDVIARIFTLWLTEKELAHFSLVNKPLTGYFVDESQWGEYCIDQSRQKPRDPFLGIETLFCQKNL